MKRIFGITFLITLIISVVSVTVFVGPSLSYARETPGGDKKVPKTDTKDGLIPVPDPLLDRLEKAVIQQLIERRKAFDALAKKPGISRVQLATAYGELGQLYHAYEFTEAAEACYRNALVLDPSNLEWRGD